MTTSNRTLEAHEADKASLEEALEFFSETSDKPLLTVAADVLESARSIYRLMDPRGHWEGGTVEKTSRMWKFTATDGCVFRSYNVDLIAVRAL